ncbi:DNA alkylation repair protein [Seleniivibrio sp.]|uniref:DNA alkylation repair protein n=1 Tax=Seleniivibrio sp. TaxID=2898801 RepID=UPI0025EB9002|nr:DNA alkylation repair protein [Seleniivibrio sp.]MCD8552813.1 DNA alkylation repair protein [Seleniivibrio sp.]
MTKEEVLTILKEKSSEENKEGMAKFGINTANAYGVTVADLREISKKLRKDHDLALELWDTGIHEARILATIFADKNRMDSDLLEKWVMDINSWDLCDQFCTNLAYKTESGKLKVYEWAVQNETFVKRAGFVLIANFASKDETLTQAEIDSYCTLILNECDDSRNYVRKAVSWALRNIGKRNEDYRKHAVKIAKVMRDGGSKTAKTTATEVLNELNSKEVKTKFRPKK